MSQEHLEDNEATWNKVHREFINASALPVWGPFGVGDDLGLIPDIAGLHFLEIACGSGRSIKYLTERGAAHVYGVDISEKQLQEAASYNQDEIALGKVTLLKGSMETGFDIAPVDIVFSIYGIGWTIDPATTLRHIFSYLKPGGLFIWSWDHSIFSDVVYENDTLIVKNSYHEEKLVRLENWKKHEGATVHLVYRKTSSWFKLLRDSGFEILEYHEPAPKNQEHGSDKPTRYYSIQKAEKVPATFIFVCRKKD